MGDEDVNGWKNWSFEDILSDCTGHKKVNFCWFVCALGF